MKIHGGELTYHGVVGLNDKNDSRYRAHQYEWKHPDGRVWRYQMDVGLFEEGRFVLEEAAQMALLSELGPEEVA